MYWQGTICRIQTTVKCDWKSSKRCSVIFHDSHVCWLFSTCDTSRGYLVICITASCQGSCLLTGTAAMSSDCSLIHDQCAHYNNAFKAAKSCRKAPAAQRDGIVLQGTKDWRALEYISNSLLETLHEFCFLWPERHWVRNPINYTERTLYFPQSGGVFLKSIFSFLLRFGKGT